MKAKGMLASGLEGASDERAAKIVSEMMTDFPL